MLATRRRPPLLPNGVGVGEQNAFVRQRVEHRFCLSTITALTLGQLEANGAASSIHERMDLGGQAASGTSHAAMKIPFLGSHRAGGA
jgi:hypothetical protein